MNKQREQEFDAWWAEASQSWTATAGDVTEDVARLAYAAGQAAAPAAQLSEEQLKHLRRYVEWCGPIHSRSCPADDTCACEWKPTLDAINDLLREGEK